MQNPCICNLQCQRHTFLSDHLLRALLLLSQISFLSFVLPFKIPNPPPWCKFVFADEVTDFKDINQIKSLYAGYSSHSLDITSFRKYGLPLRISGSLVERVRAYAKQAPRIAKNNKHSVINVYDLRYALKTNPDASIGDLLKDSTILKEVLIGELNNKVLKSYRR